LVQRFTPQRGGVVDSQADSRAASLIERARTERRDALLATEGFELVEALGIRVPTQAFIRNRDEAGDIDLSAFANDRVVVKAASPALPHKTDIGAVAIVPAAPGAIRDAVDRMARRLVAYPVYGYTVAEFIPHAMGFADELLLGLRNTADFGPVVVIGPGGVHAELLARHLNPGANLAVLARPLDTASMGEALAMKPATRIAAGLGRDHRRLLPLDRLAALADRLLAFAESEAGQQLAELEINPLALTCDGPVALDALVTLRRAPLASWPERPLEKLDNLLTPRSIALIGVSQGVNPGRLILRNLLRAGFPGDAITIVKPGVAQLDGVRCCEDLASLPQPADLCVLAVAAPQVPDVLGQIVAGRRAESVLVIPSGLGEQEGSDALEQRVRDTLVAARQTAWRGPVVNGGNCLGLRSAPGHYDATFIPEYKVRPPECDGRGSALPPWGTAAKREQATPIALIAQSGAFAIARWSKLAGLNPRYLISVGNQTDLTLGDGRRWLDAAAAIVESGRTVLLYRSARTPAGVRAGVSHTAAIAGDYVVTRELARAAGVLVADSLEEFDDLLRLFALLSDHRAAGMRVGVMSNAGFECVVAADSLGSFRLARLGPATTERLRSILAGAGLGRFTTIAHPLDVSPMTADGAFVACARTLLEDDGVDVGVIGVVPLTGALHTLPPGADHDEDLSAPDAVAAGLERLFQESHKPWIAVVDAGAAYDPLAARLEAARIPTFRSMDRALAAFAIWCGATGRHECPVDPYAAAPAVTTVVERRPAW
jgi:acyl-CoA synthetase (NDP forming)